MMAIPEWLVPMAVTLTQERFAGPDWIFERKFDGIRLLAFKDGAGVRLYSRNRLLQDIPAVADAIARLPARELVLDGEVTWDQRHYHVFDVLWRDGQDLRPRIEWTVHGKLRHPRLTGVRDDKPARDVVREAT